MTDDAADMETWPAGLRRLALIVEAQQACAWAEGVRRRDGRDPAFDQRELCRRLVQVRRLLATLPDTSDALLDAVRAFERTLAARDDVPPPDAWPEAAVLRAVIRRRVHADLPPPPRNDADWVGRMRRLAARPWIGVHAWGCPAGWLPLLERATVQIERWVPTPSQTSQIKEKFGTLRWYGSGGDDRRTVIIDFAELASTETCLACGAAGRSRTQRPWILTLCDLHDRMADDPDAGIERLAYPPRPRDA